MADPRFDPAALPFPEADAYWRNKIRLPTSGYTDIWEKQHALSFVVAGAHEDRLLEDIYNAVDKARSKGGYDAFKTAFPEIVKKHGWAHNGAPGWRSRLIYNTNVRQAWLAGKYQQQEKEKVLRPYRIYIHSGAEHYRPDHKSWDGILLPCDDPWWDTHKPQNGYGCGCDTDTLSRREAQIEWEARGKSGPDEAPEIVWEEKIVGKNTGNPRVVMTPKGIDPGFGYDPGKAYMEPWTVPPFDGYEKVFQSRGIDWPAGTPLPVAPTPTTLSASVVFPKGTPPKVLVEEFLREFGATLDTPAVFTDPAMSSLLISRALFVQGSDKSTDAFKWLASSSKADRYRYVGLFALTLKNPDEIWWAWEQSRNKPGQWLLRRRYLRAFNIEGDLRHAIGVFEWGRAGWYGNTVFATRDSDDVKERNRYFNGQRKGRLIYKTRPPGGRVRVDILEGALDAYT
ncbi:MAG: hypothetical protein LBD67_06445 [Candidatus Accumulibacter sp.]|jgi:hypothetical protein|nr:hypothetical protein [Accumulibacter sp.]